MIKNVHRCLEAGPFLAVWIVAVACGSCSKRVEIQQLPDEIREHTKFAGFLSYEKKSRNEYVLAFDANRDSKADTWELWELNNTPALYMALADKDFDGSVDTWIYFNPTSSVYLERDTDRDGKPDRRVLREGKILTLNANGTSWCDMTNYADRRTE